MPLSIGLIGLGRWGLNIKRTLESLGVTVIVIERNHIVPEKLDGVCIATPSSTHVEVALPYIERGIPTFIEKPMATSSADVARLEEAARTSGAPIFVGHIYLYNPAFRKIVELARTIGIVQGMSAEGANDAPRSDSTVLWDWLPHHVAMAREILGINPSRVSVTSAATHAIRDAAIITYMFGSIPLVSRISWVSPEKKRMFTIVGTEGTIVFDETADHKITLVKGSDVEHPLYEAEPPLTVELRAFLNMVQTRREDRPHLVDARDIIRAIEAAEEAAASGSVVTIA